jgi:hypothetical protein
MKLLRDDCVLNAKAGELLVVDADYEWDPEKVVVIAVLRRGSALGRSEYKENLATVTANEMDRYLCEGK